MTQNLYLLKKYSNYYNRIVRKEDSLNDYLSYLIDDGTYGIVSGVNFNPADGVNSTQVFNVPAMSNTILDEDPDYLLVCDGNTNDIVSRWFVIDSERLRNGQVKLTLRRDLMVDYYNSIINSHTFIEKATLPPEDPLIYNSERMMFNQIKSREDLLYDDTQSPWIVGYLAENTETEKVISAESKAIETVKYSDIQPYLSGTTKSSSGRCSVSFNLAVDFEGLKWNFEVVDYYHYKINYNDALSVGPRSTNQAEYVGHYRRTAGRSIAQTNSSIRSYVSSHKESFFNAILSRSGYVVNDLRKWDGKYVLIGGVYYKISISTNVTTEVVDMYVNTDAGYAYDNLVKNMPYVDTYTHTPFFYTDFRNKNVYDAELEILEQSITLMRSEFGSTTVSISDNVRKLQDNPFIMFALRYTDANLSLAIAMGKAYGSQCYDVQVLPYCPLQDRINTDGSINIAGMISGFDYAEIKKSDVVIDYIYFCTRSIFTFDIPYEIEVKDVKIENECDIYRLTSPNGNGVFEFNAAKNGGVTKINVDCSYKPINPYVHLNIDFKGLYGNDYNDYRGLILSGDFSIPAINDEWVNYEISNKNYENIFNRNIEHLDVTNKFKMYGDIAEAVTGSASSATLGAGLGGPVGAVAGATAGLITGMADVAINAMLRDEAKDLTVDLYNYNLQNIQALPNSITKTGCLTNNNKLVPYIEYYTPTDREKDSLRQKLKWNGMTVMVIGKIKDYLSDDYSYVKGQLIRYEGLEGVDFHTINSISSELNKGVYIK